MNNLILKPITTANEKNIFIVEIQEAFQKAFEEIYGPCDEKILPREDIEDSFNCKGSEAYVVEVNGVRVGGTIIVVDRETGFNSLHLLYVKTRSLTSGIGV